MLESLFGNLTVEKVLYFIYNYGEGYPKQMADTFNISLNGIQQQLKRLEDGGILVSQKKGNIRLFTFNPRYYFLKELKDLLKKAMNLLPEIELKKYFRQRRRPRKQGKL
jgi:DNA-binding transcriptional ArsR family regulator